MTFDEWWDGPDRIGAPNTYRGWEDTCRRAWDAGQAELRAENERLRACLDRWRHDGRLQTYDDRERFRAEAGALLLPNARVTGAPEEEA